MTRQVPASASVNYGMTPQTRDFHTDQAGSGGAAAQAQTTM